MTGETIPSGLLIGFGVGSLRTGTGAGADHHDELADSEAALLAELLVVPKVLVIIDLTSGFEVESDEGENSLSSESMSEKRSSDGTREADEVGPKAGGAVLDCCCCCRSLVNDAAINVFDVAAAAAAAAIDDCFVVASSRSIGRIGVTFELASIVLLRITWNRIFCSVTFSVIFWCMVFSCVWPLNSKRIRLLV